MSYQINIRAANVCDVDGIEALLTPYAQKKVVLQRSKDDVFQHLQEFIVAEYEGVLVGTAALHVYASHIAEVRSLVVNPEYQGMKIGQLLVKGCEHSAMQLGVDQVFALTYVDQFFLRMDYKVVLKESLPHKIWTVCVHCNKFSDCDEIAVMKYLAKVNMKSNSAAKKLDEYQLNSWDPHG
ncbi:MAG: N-acetyltransferase [Mariprofundaceae bacterium]|nr:N-acetyltransferase [Mariprofundaceae bacterium]